MKSTFYLGLICGGLLFLAQLVNAIEFFPFLIPSLFLNIIVYVACGIFGIGIFLKKENKRKNYKYLKGISICQSIFLIGLLIFSFLTTSMNYFYGEGYTNWFSSFYYLASSNFVLPFVISFFIPIAFIWKNQNEIQEPSKENILDDI